MRMSSDESIWRMRVLSTAMPEYVGELVRCKDCAHMSKNPLVGCGWICSYFGFPLPDRDGFCAWGETEEDYSDE